VKPLLHLVAGDVFAGGRFYRGMKRVLREVCAGLERVGKFDRLPRRTFSRNLSPTFDYMEKVKLLPMAAGRHTNRLPDVGRGRLWRTEL